MIAPISIKWALGHDKYKRTVMLERKGDDYSIIIEPYDQRDDGPHRLDDLSKHLILAAAQCINEDKAR